MPRPDVGVYRVTYLLGRSRETRRVQLPTVEPKAAKVVKPVRTLLANTHGVPLDRISLVSITPLGMEGSVPWPKEPATPAGKPTPPATEGADVVGDGPSGDENENLSGGDETTPSA
jgi:hypothetical protein